jgi:phosphoglycerate dehydrogenase-like enzyme
MFWHGPIDPDDPILHKNVFVTPHIGGVTRQAGCNTALKFVANVDGCAAVNPYRTERYDAVGHVNHHHLLTGTVCGGRFNNNFDI